jgi:iron complex outermembrane recepter protein
VDSANSLRTKPYALLGAKVGYDNARWFSAYVEGRNLTNVKYIASASIAERANLSSMLFEPGSGLAIYAGMKFRLN